MWGLDLSWDDSHRRKKCERYSLAPRKLGRAIFFVLRRVESLEFSIRVCLVVRNLRIPRIPNVVPTSKIPNALPPFSIINVVSPGIYKAKSGFSLGWNSKFLYQTRHLECSMNKS